MKAVAAEQIGTALRAMAEDLVSERRRVLVLRVENRQLRAQLDAAGLTADRRVVSPPNGGSKDARRGQLPCRYCGRPLPYGQR
jgi:hypothetical protein